MSTNPEKAVMQITHDELFNIAQHVWPSNRRMWCVDGELPKLRRFADALLEQASRSALGDECLTCGGHGMIGGHSGQTPESYEEHADPCPDCNPAPAVKDALPGAEGMRAALEEVVRVIERGSPAITDTIWVSDGTSETLLDHCLAALEKASPAVPAGEPVADRCVICQSVMRDDDDSGLCDEHKYDEQPYAWLTPGGDVYRSRKMAMEFCMPPKLPQPLFTRPSGAVPVEAKPVPVEEIRFACHALTELVAEVGLEITRMRYGSKREAAIKNQRKVHSVVAALEQFIAGVKV